MSRIAQTARIVLVALVLSVVGMAFFVTSSGAVPVRSVGAFGCSFGNPWLGPDSYCVVINGSGTYVETVGGRFSGSSFVCDWRITAEFFDKSWRWYQTIPSGTHRGCSTAGTEAVWVGSRKKPGFMCSTLHYKNTPSSGWRRMSVCHRIS